jgi:hypothetical protein
LNETATARLHAAAKSLQVLTTSRAKFAAVAGSTNRIVGLRNSRKHSKEHRYAERRTNDSVYRHLSTSLPSCRSS